MSEDRFPGIEQKLNTLVSGQGDLQVGQARIASRLDRVELGLDKVDSRLDKVESRLGNVESRLDSVDSRLDNVDSRLHKVEVTQEAMRDEIKQIAEGHGATQAAIQRATKVICDRFDGRIMPLEDIVRVHFGTR